MSEETITVREAFDRCYPKNFDAKGAETLATFLFQITRCKTIVCFNCKHVIERIEVKEEKGTCPLCKAVLFNWVNTKKVEKVKS